MAEFGEKTLGDIKAAKSPAQKRLVHSMLYALAVMAPTPLRGMDLNAAPEPVEPRACLECGQTHTVKDRSFCSGECCNRYRNKRKINHKSVIGNPNNSVLK